MNVLVNTLKYKLFITIAFVFLMLFYMFMPENFSQDTPVCGKQWNYCQCYRDCQDSGVSTTGSGEDPSECMKKCQQKYPSCKCYYC